MHTQRILLSVALIGLGLLGSAASAHHVRGTTRQQHARAVAHPRQAYYWQYGPSRPTFQSYRGYCPPPPLIRNRDAGNDGYVSAGEYCD